MKLHLQINNPAKHKGSFDSKIINAWNQGLLTKSKNCTTLVTTLRVSLLKASDHHLHHILQQLVVITLHQLHQLLIVDVNYYVIICSKFIAKN